MIFLLFTFNIMFNMYTDMIVLVLYFSHKINIIMGTKFTELSNIVISF